MHRHNGHCKVASRGQPQRANTENKLIMRILGLTAFIGTALMAALVVDAFAFDPKVVGSRQSPATRPAPPEIAPQALFLIRSTLATLNDANRTGNYSVLRDLASPSFQEANSPADIAAAFAQLRRRQVDLSMAAIVTPKLTSTTSAQQGKPWQLSGYVPMETQRIVFDMRFDPVGGHWRLAALSIGTGEPPVAGTQAKPQ